MRWFLLFLLGLTSLKELGALAAKENHLTLSKEALRCKSSLEQVRLRLEAHSKQGSPIYYQDLYRQVQSILGALEYPSRSFQLSQCENLLNAIQDIIGPSLKETPVGPTELAPMPTEHPSLLGGKLTNPTLETSPKRPLRPARPMSPLSIHYKYDHLESDEEKKEDPEDFKLKPSLPPYRSGLAGTKKIPNLKEKELE